MPMPDFRASIRSAAILAILAVAACSGPTGAEDQAQTPSPAPAAAPPVPEVPPVTPPVTTGDTVGGDGSPILLTALSSADLEATKLSGELGCSFSSPTASPLLVAMGNVASQTPAQGVVKVLDSVERVTAPGGFNGMLKGTTFVGQGKTLVVALTGQPPVGGGESPAYPATLTYDRADGARRTIEGSWTCGP
jgi:hypothetical protein